MTEAARGVHAPRPAELAAQAAARFLARPDVFDVEVLWATDAALHLASTLFTLASDWPVDIPAAVTAGETEAARKRFLEPLASRGVVRALSPSKPPAEGVCSLVSAVLGEAEAHALRRYEAGWPTGFRDVVDHLVGVGSEAPSAEDRRLAGALLRAARAVLHCAAARHPHGIPADGMVLRRPRRAAPTWLERCRVLRASMLLAAAGGETAETQDPKLRHLGRAAEVRATAMAIGLARASLTWLARQPPSAPA